MDIRFLCLQGGRQYFEVVLQGEPIFVGSRSECDRFMAIHEEKVAQDQADDLRDPRSRAVPVRVYHHSRARA
jgi:hypothetical protein